MKIHHTTKSEYGNCLICGKPILNIWFDAEEKTGHSEQFQERKNGSVHFACIPGAKSLHQLNEEKKHLHV